MRRALLIALTLSLLLTRVPHLLAVGANNLATWLLISEWEEVSRELSIPRCGERWKDSAAARHAAAALRWYPGYQRALVNKGRLAWLQGNCSTAQASWERALATAPRDRATALWLFWASGADTDELPEVLSGGAFAGYAFHAGERARRTGDMGAAVAWYELSLDVTPNREAARQLAGIYEREGRVPEAIDVWQRVGADLLEEDPDHWWAMGMAAELAQEWELATRAYKRGGEVAGKPYEFWMRQGDVLRYLQRWDEAEKVFRQALTARPDISAPYLYLGHIQREQGHYSQALGWYLQAETVAPEDLAPIYYQGLTYYLLGQDDEACAHLKNVLVVNPGHLWANYYLAQSLHRSGKEAQAVEFLSRALNIDPKQQRWRWAVQLGDWRLALGDCEGALCAYRRAVQWGADDERVQERIQELSE